MPWVTDLFRLFAHDPRVAVFEWLVALFQWGADLMWLAGTHTVMGCMERMAGGNAILSGVATKVWLDAHYPWVTVFEWLQGRHPASLLWIAVTLWLPVRKVSLACIQDMAAVAPI